MRATAMAVVAVDVGDHLDADRQAIGVAADRDRWWRAASGRWRGRARRIAGRIGVSLPSIVERRSAIGGVVMREGGGAAGGRDHRVVAARTAASRRRLLRACSSLQSNQSASVGGGRPPWRRAARHRDVEHVHVMAVLRDRGRAASRWCDRRRAPAASQALADAARLPATIDGLRLRRRGCSVSSRMRRPLAP